MLHATPHLRAIKQHYPDAQLTVLTANTSAEIYANNPHIDRLVLFDYPAFKKTIKSSPREAIKTFRSPIEKLNIREYDLAFDLQGLLRSVVFLYAVRAKQKFVKGRWIGLGGFRNKNLHAIDEMSRVLAEAGIAVESRQMEFHAGQEAKNSLAQKLESLALVDQGKPYVVISPFTRWESKNWPLDRFMETADQLSKKMPVFLTGAPTDRQKIQKALHEKSIDSTSIVNLAGKLNLSELAVLMKNAKLVISGDSFPMHLATAMQTPLIALFGPTDEYKTGPLTQNAVVLRPDNCSKCDKPNCEQLCLNKISVNRVVFLALETLA